jgi:cytochrome b6-f complex iron-sulfur subunit
MTALLRTIFGLFAGWLGSRVLSLLARLHVGGSVESRTVTRRTFTRNAALGAVGVVLAELTVGTVYMLWPNKTGAFGGDRTVPASSVPPVDWTQPFVDVPGKYFLVRNEDGLLALYWKCVHLGCTVPWRAGENQFHCPCHGSLYDRNGVRTAGPAPRPLDLMRVTVNGDGTVTVSTGDRRTRTDYTPDQAVPYAF